AAALIGPDFDAIRFLLEIYRALSDPHPTLAALRIDSFLGGTQAPNSDLGRSAGAKVQPIRQVDLLDHPALVAELDRLRAPPVLEFQALGINVGIAVGGNRDPIDVNSAINGNHHPRREATLVGPAFDATVF